MGDIDAPNDMICSLKISRAKVSKVLCIPTRKELGIAQYDKPPSSDDILRFVNMLGYNRELRNVSDFKRQFLPPIWNLFFSILNRSLTCKLGSLDQGNINIMTIMYGLFFNLNLDYAFHIYNEIHAAVIKKCKLQAA